jgi:hypothetical protein
MTRAIACALAFAVLSFVGCAAKKNVASDHTAVESRPPSCTMADASPWIRAWFDAWELACDDILHIPVTTPPGIVLYDSACVYTTSSLTAGGAATVDGPTLRGAKLPWRALPHGDSITLPDSSQVPIQLMSFCSVDKRTGPYFVMAAPTFWEKRVGPSRNAGFTGVFLHEFAHTQQVPGFAKIIGPIDSTWAYEEELDDDAVQKHFGSDSVYVAAYQAERDLLFLAADAESITDVRRMAKEALAMMRSRHARWFTGDKAVFATLDDTFLSLEGAAQWTAYAWLAHPQGGGLEKQAAVDKMLGKRRWWAQDESLGLFLVVDRLLPEWPTLVFNNPSIGAVALLERAVRQ